MDNSLRVHWRGGSQEQSIDVTDDAEPRRVGGALTIENGVLAAILIVMAISASIPFIIGPALKANQSGYSDDSD